MKIKTKYERTHEWLLENGPSTAEQIVRGLVTFGRINQTLYELEKKGWVKKAGQIKPLHGKLAFAYEAIPKTDIFATPKTEPNTGTDEYTCKVYDLPVIETPPKCQHILELIKECNPRELSFLKLYLSTEG